MRKSGRLKWAKAILYAWWDGPDPLLLEWMWLVATDGKMAHMPKCGIRCSSL